MTGFIFRKQLLLNSRCHSLGLFLSGLLGFLLRAGFVAAGALGPCGKLASPGMSWLAPLPCLLSFFVLCGKAGVSPCKGAAGLSLTFVFIPGVGWNNRELYFPLCGIKQRLVLLIIESIQRVSTTFLS